MKPLSRHTTNHSGKSYLERELVISLDNDGPLVGASMMALELSQKDDSSLDQCRISHDEATIEENTTKQDVQYTTEKSDTSSIHSPNPTLSHIPWYMFWKDRTVTQVDPRSFSPFKKHLILLIVSLAGSTSPISTTVYYPALVTMQNYFNTTDTLMNASLSVFTFFTAFFPLIWASFGDVVGRRRIYLISFLISVIGSICCALSVNITMFIVFRGFSAIGSSAVMSMGAGTLADIFEPHERGRAFAWYTCGPLLGPAIGPIIGGYLSQGLGWRSNFWFLTIFSSFIWITMVFFLPETWRPAPALPSSEAGVEPVKKRRFINPLSSLRLLLFPNIALAVSFVGVLLFVYYLLNTNFTRTYTIQYKLDSGTVGICYLPLAIGAMIGGISGGRISDKVYSKRVTQAGGQSCPEMRLGGPLFYSAIVLQMFAFAGYGWCVEENVHFAYGLVFQFFLGIAIMFPNVVLSAYMVDCFRKKGASVTACNNFVRYCMAGIGSLIASDLVNAIGNGILFTLCGAILFLATIFILIIIRNSKKWEKLRVGI
ncbi:major facilitator superfamily domain-containing protein [Phycomyces nitens]|nr:major facilitator superfamily domain-containing protein [Phycomyces nitens]